jgi:hypothetical protein
MIDELLPQALDHYPRGATLNDLIAYLSGRSGDWPVEGNTLFMWAVYGHLVRQEQRGTITRVRDSQPWRWKRAEGAEPRVVSA